MAQVGRALTSLFKISGQDDREKFIFFTQWVAKLNVAIVTTSWNCTVIGRDAASIHQPDSVSARSLWTRLAWKGWCPDHREGKRHKNIPEYTRTPKSTWNIGLLKYRYHKPTCLFSAGLWCIVGRLPQQAGGFDTTKSGCIPAAVSRSQGNQQFG